MSVKAFKRSSVEASRDVSASALQLFNSSTITISNLQHGKKINLRLLKKIVAELLEELKITDAELEINLVGAAEMTRLNEKFLGHEGSTDVITFDYGVGRASRRSDSKIKKIRDRRDACPTFMGEIFICVDEAVSQSKKFKTSWQSEIVRYVVHGILHLLGHDDLRAKAKSKMKREENRLLRELSQRFALSKL